jgi:phosphatidylserine/phosphatidylglycerophosphate/cardiolipin synthase-like enzyme
VLTQKGDPWAYVGGIDVAVDRWDTPDHTSPRERQRELLDGWHDVHCAIQGPAVSAIAENFRDRWNERKPPMRSSPGDLPDLIRAPLNVPSASRGSLMVQRLRTLACDGLYDFRPGGEQTSRQGINRAIDQSKYYVYIEDQYFWPSTTVERLTAAVRRGVHVFLVLAKAFDAPVQLFARAHYEMRKEALEMLRGAGADRVVCCHLEQTQSLTQIYVHSKFIIVDDRFVTIGSTNIGRRSHTTDTELNVSMVDAQTVGGVMGGRPVTVCRFAQDLRKRVWNEHLNIPESELHDPIASKGRWPQQRKGSKKVHHAVYHSGEPPAVPIALGDWYRFLKALREAARQPKPWPNATQAELTLVEDVAALLDTLDADLLQTGVSELALHGLGPIWWAPRVGLKARLIEFIKNRLMNVETKCGLA